MATTCAEGEPGYRPPMANPGRIVTAGIGLTMALAIGSVGCSNAEESVKVLADELAEQGVAAWAEGRWTCEGQIGDGELRDVSAVVAIGGDGRFSWERVGETPVQSGTWAIEGLEVR
ncbi:MAG: hypothetical protein JWM47_561, partial [Acidimicrobiales bacterium]|nr:hypothetical protein [Acidimicrobiales bacterium]